MTGHFRHQALQAHDLPLQVAADLRHAAHLPREGAGPFGRASERRVDLHRERGAGHRAQGRHRSHG